MLERRARMGELDDLQEINVDLDYYATQNPAFGR